MEIDLLVTEIQRDHCVHTGEQQSIRHLDFPGRDGHRHIAVAQDRLRIAHRQDQIVQLAEFLLELDRKSVV